MAAADAQASAASASLPPLRDVIARHGLAARRSLGQHFLLDLNLTGRIARAAGDLSQGTVIEIGPGPGGLTRALLENGAAQVVAVERDERCRPVLEEIAAVFPGRLNFMMADALAVEIAALGPAAAPHRRQPALQCLHGAAAALACRHRLHRQPDADVPEGGRRPADGGAAQQGLRPSQRARAVAVRGAAPVRHLAPCLHAATEGDIDRPADHAARPAVASSRTRRRWSA